MVSIEVYVSVLLCFLTFTHFYNKLLVKKLKQKHKEMRDEIETLKALYFVKSIRDTGLDSILAGSNSYDKEIVITLKSRKEFDSVFGKRDKTRFKNLEESIEKLKEDISNSSLIQTQEVK
jgi:hypothetical protein